MRTNGTEPGTRALFFFCSKEKDGDRTMTQKEAISFLRKFKRFTYSYDDRFIIFPKRNDLFETCVYGQFLVDEIIREIRRADGDPIKIAGKIYTRLDDVLGDSDDDHFETHRFAAVMEREAGNILRYLKSLDKGENRHE